MTCSTSLMGAIVAAGLVGRGDVHLALVGGVETMSHRPIALRQAKADAIASTAMKDMAAALALVQAITPQDFDLPGNAGPTGSAAARWGSHCDLVAIEATLEGRRRSLDLI